MTAAHLDAPTRPLDAGPAPSEPPHVPQRRRPPRPSRPVAALIAALLVLGGGLTAQQARNAEASAAAERAARAEFTGDVGAVRAALADPARDGQRAATALLRHQLLLVAGEAPDATVGERLVARLHTAADELADAAAAPLPDRPDGLPDDTVEPLLEQLAGIGDHATDLADTFRISADDAEAWLAAVRAVDDAARAYADSTEQLPRGDDPGPIAEAWRAERTLLEDYAAALGSAGEHEASAPLAVAHQQLVDGMRDVAGDALTALEAEDIDAYNALLDERLGGEDPFAFGAALEEARAEVAEATIDGPLEDTRARALGLLTELEELRRATPPRLAEVA